jgi:oligopeptide transport system ATP-binding protein
VFGNGTIIMNDTLVDIKNLKVHFPVQQGMFFSRSLEIAKAVDGVNLTIPKGKTLGLVGESGCGKSTTARAVLQLIKATEGEVFFEGQDLTKLSPRALRKQRRNFQMIFQDPYASLNPRMTVGSIIGEPLQTFGDVRGKDLNIEVQRLIELVGLNPRHVRRYPHEFSGGQRQRIGVARALALKPKLIVADEPVSALDVSIQAQILNLLIDLKDEFKLTYLFISHDLAVVRHISDIIAVMYLGKIVEVAPASEIYEKPKHPYTQALLSAVPIPDPKIERVRQRVVLTGDMPSPLNPPSGCRFHTRCPEAMPHCTRVEPVLKETSARHQTSCHLYD